MQEARRLSGEDLEDASQELVAGDLEANWTERGAKKAIRRAQAAGTPRLSKGQQKKLKGRGWSHKPAVARKAGLRGYGISDSPGRLHTRHPGTGSSKDLILHRANQNRPEGYETKQDVRKLAKAVDAGETPPAVATRDPKTGELAQHSGRTRHTASKLMGGQGAEFATILPKDRYKAVRSMERRNRRIKAGGKIPPSKDQDARGQSMLMAFLAKKKKS